MELLLGRRNKEPPRGFQKPLLSLFLQCPTFPFTLARTCHVQVNIHGGFSQLAKACGAFWHRAVSCMLTFAAFAGVYKQKPFEVLCASPAMRAACTLPAKEHRSARGPQPLGLKGREPARSPVERGHVARGLAWVARASPRRRVRPALPGMGGPPVGAALGGLPWVCLGGQLYPGPPRGLGSHRIWGQTPHRAPI